MPQEVLRTLTPDPLFQEGGRYGQYDLELKLSDSRFALGRTAKVAFGRFACLCGGNEKGRG
jgi:hypothetical protein